MLLTSTGIVAECTLAVPRPVDPHWKHPRTPQRPVRTRFPGGFTMKSVNRIICVTAAIALSVLAQSTIAAGPQKTYSIRLTSNPTYTGDPPQLVVPVPVTVTVKNESPPSTANSNIGSFRFTVVGLSIDSTQPISCPRALCSATGNTVTVTNISAPIQAQEEYPISFSARSCGDGQLANISVYNGSSVNGNTFNFKASPSILTSSVSCGDLDCSTEFSVPDSGGSTILVHRGVDKDGVCFINALPYYVTNTLPVVHFRWPVGADPNADSAAAFRYVITATPSGNGPKVAWLTDNAGSPIFIAAPSCLGDLPTAYGSLAADVANSDKKIAVNTTAAVPAVPFAIVIGSERMDVTKVTNNQWTVTRHTGGTSASAHFANDPVMSTPLPILSASSGPYSAGSQAQMCLLNQSGNTTTIIDIGDGWSSP